MNDTSKAIKHRRQVDFDHTDALYDLNDKLTAWLSIWGWVAESDDDYDDLNDLTHEVFDALDNFITEREGE